MHINIHFDTPSLFYFHIAVRLYLHSFFDQAFSRQKSGIKRNSTVKISKRPTSIRKLSNHFPKAGTAEKFEAGPVDPNPGPALLKLVMHEPRAESISNPIIVSKQVPIITITR